MLCRERFLHALTFRPVDRIPLVEWPVRKSTMDAWISQGFPDGCSPQEFFSLDTFHLSVPIVTGMHPRFEEETLELTNEYRIWRDSTGAVRKDFLTMATPGFVTRSYQSFPVSGRADFQKIKARYDGADPGRYPPSWPVKAATLNRAHVNNQLTVPGLFWTARDWMGFEGLCMAFYDEPALVEEMFELITDTIIATLSRGIGDIAIDVVMISEDMAYKGSSMISPEMFRKFMFGHYVRLVGFLKGHGVKLALVDSDGYPEKLIPLWAEAGIDGLSPCEIAAGNDMLELRRRYPRFAFMGGIDKREIAKDRKAIFREVVSKVPCLIEKGGYIPHIDHAIPPDISLENYLYYRELLSRVAHGESLRD